MAEEIPRATGTTTTHGGGHQKSDLVSSAKIVAEAAQAAASHQTDKIDKAKVAGAAEELIGAARTYGKLDDKGVGQYLEKAEGYLHKMHSSDSCSTPSAAAHGGDAGHKEKHGGGGHDGHDGGGHAAGMMKMAQGLFK